jgi:hypothetical protein
VRAGRRLVEREANNHFGVQGSEEEGRMRSRRIRHDPYFRQTKRAHESGKVLTMRISGPIGHTIGPIGHTFGAHVVRIVVAAAVCYGAIMTGESGEMTGPHPVVLKAAVNKYSGSPWPSSTYASSAPLVEMRLISPPIVLVIIARLPAQLGRLDQAPGLSGPH